MSDRDFAIGSDWDFRSFDWPESDAIVAGADLESSTILAAYAQGLFPMPADGELVWWSPVERGVLGPGDLRVSSSLRKSLKNFTFTVDQDFEAVIGHCADPDRPAGWIDSDIREAYVRLHHEGWAHSVETRDSSGRLVGGLYGLMVGGLFCGESMFHLERDASKAALAHLVELLSARDEWLIDTQWVTPHLASLGVRTMARDTYLGRIREIIGNSSRF